MCCYRRSKDYVVCPPCDYLKDPDKYSVLKRSMYKNNVPWWDIFFSKYEKYGRTYTYEEIIKGVPRNT